MANNENLRKGKDTQFSKQSGEEAVRNGKKGGKSSGKSKRKSKIFKEAITQILDSPTPDKMVREIQELFNLTKGIKITLKEAMIFAQILKAIRDGDTQAFNALVDRVDGKAIQSIETSEASTRELCIITQDRMNKEKELLDEEIVGE